MAVIHRSDGGVRPRADNGARTVLGRAPVRVSETSTANPAPLDPRERLEVDALLAHAARNWADRLADEEAALAPEAAGGFAARIGAMLDVERESLVANLPTRLRAHAAAGLTAVGEKVIANARQYEDLATRVGDFNVAKRATDDIAALVAHDPDAHDRLREEGLEIVARAPVSSAGRELLGRRFAGELANARAMAHIDDDPADAYAALSADPPARRPPYDALSDEQRRHLATRAQIEDARRRSIAESAEQHPEDMVDAGSGSRPEAEVSAGSETDGRALSDVPDGRTAEENATAEALARFEKGGEWDPDDPADVLTAERVWVALGGDIEALLRGEDHARKLLLHVTSRTGIVPDDVLQALERRILSGTPAQRAYAEKLASELPLPKEDEALLADFGLDREQIDGLSRESSADELALWLRRVRSIHDPHGEYFERGADLRDDIHDAFQDRDTTRSLLHRRLSEVIEGGANVMRRPGMFPPEMVEAHQRLKSRVEFIAGIATDLAPGIGDLKAAVDLAWSFADLLAAVESGDDKATRAAGFAFIFALTDVAPGPNIVRIVRKLMKRVDGLPLPASLKDEIRKRLDDQGLLDEVKWKRRVDKQRFADSRQMGRINEKSSLKRLGDIPPGMLKTQVGIRTPLGMRYVDQGRVSEELMLRLVEVKTTSRSGKRRKVAEQRRKDEAIARGEGVFTSDWPPYFKKGDKVPPVEVEYEWGDPIPSGLRKIWLLRIRNRSMR